jgi:predicted DNA-binding transcriptional regulator AlpA
MARHSAAQSRDTSKVPAPLQANASLRADEAAAYLGISKSWLAKLRLRSSAGPRFIKLSPRLITYRLSDLEAWRDARCMRSTSDIQQAA